MNHIGHPLLGDPIYNPKCMPSKSFSDKRNDAVCITRAAIDVGEEHPDFSAVYGGEKCLIRAALHAGEITFHQPFTGEDIVLRAEIPKDFLPYISDMECKPV